MMPNHSQDSPSHKRMYFAHSANPCGDWHRLADHLSSVSKLASESLHGLRGSEEAGLAGLLHDLGKYGDLFQARLRGEAQGLDHWSQGAWVALMQHKAIASALAIQGHHIGLQCADEPSLRGLNPRVLSKQHPLKLSLSDGEVDRLLTRLQTDGLDPTKPEAAFAWPFSNIAAMLDVRMLFSALVDADFLDTEAHFNGTAQGKVYRPKGPKLRPDKALEILYNHMAELRKQKAAACESRVLAARDALWGATTKAGQRPPGLWTLTAPTGSGKTLAMLNFALDHARVRAGRLDRIIMVIPYLTIIEQTAHIYRQIFETYFGEHYVLEHHSLTGLGEENTRQDAESESERMRRLLSENWDAPIIVTTNVQLLESLFSNRPAACRKLHRLARSVILFDEAQALPAKLAVPTLAALSHLSAEYGTSVVFATATQPAFDHLDKAVRTWQDSRTPGGASGWVPRPILPDETTLFRQLSRTRIHWPQAGQRVSFEALAEALTEQRQVLCIVNLKRHALKLISTIRENKPETVYHLSTNLCPAHRQDVLKTVRERLDKGQPCRLISTQCVEAGVDVDFPVVHRALGPLEAIAQAAGRCNRNGLLRDPDGRPCLGEVHVFIPDQDAKKEEGMYPGFAYYQAASLTQLLLAEKGESGLDLDDPQTFRNYYKRLYDLSKPETQSKDLLDAVQAQHFPEVARQYHIISQDSIMILVPYANRLDKYRVLRVDLDAHGLNASWMRRAQLLCVSLYRPERDHPIMGLLLPARLPRGGVSDEWFVLGEEFAQYYDPLLGFNPPEVQAVLIG